MYVYTHTHKHTLPYMHVYTYTNTHCSSHYVAILDDTSFLSPKHCHNLFRLSPG